MKPEQFLDHLQEHAASFAKAVATNEGEWIIKGFIDVYQRVYSISVDTKIVSKVLELLLFPMFVEFAKKHGLEIELCQQQNSYPDLTFTHTGSGNRFAVDIKSSYRENVTKVNGMTLGAFTGYFRNRDSNKNILYPYSQYAAHIVLGVIYTKCDDVADERNYFSLDNLAKIPSVIKDFEFFAQPKFKIATAGTGSGNTKNIGAAKEIATLISGSGPFASLGEEVYDDYWMFYLTRDMAEAVGVKRPYKNLKTYLEYKQRGTDTLKAHAKEIASLAEDEPENEEAGS
ncbi:MAG TPA: type II restriction endonuclease [Verrucomicrobiae bacterium]|nr:type II restriction endonuclease [Verrucomicrobiae bacterium]